MKKLTSIILLVTMLLTTATLSACMHKCTPAEAWTTDAAEHWHKCTDESCEEIFDKALHVWDEGTITKAATQEAEGTKTFTCDICKATKTESVPFTGMTKEAWKKAIATENFGKNFTYTETSILKTTGMEIETVTIYEFEETKGKVTITVAGETESQRLSLVDTTTYRNSLLDTLNPMVKFEDYKYDAATKTYVLTGEFTIVALGVKSDTCSLTFEDGKLVKMVYTCKITQNGITFDVTSTVVFSDYGTTSVK